MHETAAVPDGRQRAARRFTAARVLPSGCRSAVRAAVGHLGRRVVLTTVVAAVAGACAASDGEASAPLPLLEGESVVDGSPLSSEDFAGDVLVVNAWATWCVPCRTEQPALIRTFDAYQDQGVSFLGIDHLDDRASATHWIKEEFDVPYPSLFDPAGEFAAKLGYPGLPATFVVDETGTIRFRRFGPITEQRLTRMLDRVIGG